jgi:hypothetical protein
MSYVIDETRSHIRPCPTFHLDLDIVHIHQRYEVVTASIPFSLPFLSPSLSSPGLYPVRRDDADDIGNLDAALGERYINDSRRIGVAGPLITWSLDHYLLQLPILDYFDNLKHTTWHLRNSDTSALLDTVKISSESPESFVREIFIM